VRYDHCRGHWASKGLILKKDKLCERQIISILSCVTNRNDETYAVDTTPFKRPMSVLFSITRHGFFSKFIMKLKSGYQENTHTQKKRLCYVSEDCLCTVVA
jgi:hypothetical protein